MTATEELVLTLAKPVPEQVMLKEGLHRGIDCKEEEEGKGSIGVWCAWRVGSPENWGAETD